MKTYFTIQDDPKEFANLHPWVLVILADIILWCLKNKLPLVLTSLLRPENDGISESTTHQDGRALDIGVKGWPEAKIKELEAYLCKKYEAVGAISSKTGKPLACYYHNNGNGWHFHIQVRPLEFIKQEI